MDSMEAWMLTHPLQKFMYSLQIAFAACSLCFSSQDTEMHGGPSCGT
jgi:hypothetical protein